MAQDDTRTASMPLGIGMLVVGLVITVAMLPFCILVLKETFSSSASKYLLYISPALFGLGVFLAICGASYMHVAHDLNRHKKMLETVSKHQPRPKL